MIDGGKKGRAKSRQVRGGLGRQEQLLCILPQLASSSSSQLIVGWGQRMQYLILEFMESAERTRTSSSVYQGSSRSRFGQWPGDKDLKEDLKETNLQHSRPLILKQRFFTWSPGIWESIDELFGKSLEFLILTSNC